MAADTAAELFCIVSDAGHAMRTLAFRAAYHPELHALLLEAAERVERDGAAIVEAQRASQERYR